MADKLGVGIIGCGNIAGRYAANLKQYPEMELVGATDIDYSRAEALTKEHGGQPYRTTAELLADDRIQMVVNLTIHHAHKAVITEALNAGKHVYSEKPLAMTYADARELVELAQSKGLRLGCSPITWMGEAQQTAWKQIREGRLGDVRVIFAEVNWGRIETWHPAPEPFYEVGALYDVGVYPLTLITTIFGPARRVWAKGELLKPDRQTLDGRPFHVSTPDFVVSMVELESGPVVRLTTDFYVGQHSKQKGVEFHGDAGSLYISSWQVFDADVEFTEFGKKYEPVPLIKEPYHGTEWGRGARDMAQAILENRPHRATGEQAAHVVEILEAATRAMASGEAVEVHSTFQQPAPMDWAS